MFRQNWRGAEEWMAEGLPIRSSTSQQAIKLYDCALTQLVGWYDDAQQDNGLGGTLGRMVEADSNFVLGRALSLGIDLIGTGVTIRRDAKLKTELDSLKQLADQRRPEMEWREWAHVQALDKFAHGNMRAATEIWEDILLQHPTDMMALKLAHDSYFYLGEKALIRDSIARVYPVWEQKKNLPLGCYIHGMFAFGWEETQFYTKAEEQAKIGLEKQPHDAWATHALAHVYEMATKPVEGLGFLSRTMQQWNVCNFLACHNYWHWALYHIELDEPDGAAELLEKEILTRAGASGSMLDMVDACSLLYRLELLHPKSGLTTAEQSRQVFGLVEPHLDDHILGFNDTHFAMACLGVGEDRTAESLLEGLKEVQATGAVSDHWLEVTRTLLEAMVLFHREQYSKTVDKLTKIRYEIVKIGGSDAQRDVFNQLFMVAAIRANNRPLCTSLMHERRAIKGDDVVARTLSKALVISS